uniref:eCIS core domain-containing protein n=1 Tax=Micromonospora sp. S-DT3-3-22 TaxID=2755359 RepID=UPI001E29B521
PAGRDSTDNRPASAARADIADELPASATEGDLLDDRPGSVVDRDTGDDRPGRPGHDTSDDRPGPPVGRDTYHPEPVSPPSSFFLTRRPEQSPPAGSPSGVDRDHGRAGQGPPGRGQVEAVPHPPVPSAERAGWVDRPEPWTTAAPTDVGVPAYPVGGVTAAPVMADGRPGPASTTAEGTGPLTHRAGPPPTPVGVAELPEQVPAALVDGFRQQYGVDVAAVPVWRGAAATEVVQQAGARAATRGGEVLLPASAGPLDAPPARALLAHELAHVVQQRTFGAAPPAESTGTGRDLEARALAAEHAFGDGGGPGVGGVLPPVAPLTGGAAAPTPPGTAGTWGTTPGGGLTWQANPGAGGVPPAAPTGPPAAAHPLQRASMDTPAATLDDLRALVRGELDHQQDRAADQPAGPTPDALRAEVAAATAAPTIDRSAGRIAEVRDAVERLRAELRTVADRGRATAARLDRDADRVPDRSPGRPVDLENPDDLEELAGRLYGRLRGRLRQELLVDRERSGRLTQFR